MLPTGKVAFWGRPPLIGGQRENRSEFWLWDPATGGATRHDAPSRSTSTATAYRRRRRRCSAPASRCSPTASCSWPAGTSATRPPSAARRRNWRGLDRAYTFDPWTLTWREQPRPRHGRWYPSQVELADGRIAILAGFDEAGSGNKNIEMEVFTPAAERGGRRARSTTTRRATATRRSTRTCSRCKDGRVLLGGPDRARLRAARPGGAGRRSCPAARGRASRRRTSTASAATRSCGRRARPATRA